MLDSVSELETPGPIDQAPNTPIKVEKYNTKHTKVTPQARNRELQTSQVHILHISPYPPLQRLWQWKLEQYIKVRSGFVFCYNCAVHMGFCNIFAVELLQGNDIESIKLWIGRFLSLRSLPPANQFSFHWVVSPHFRSQQIKHMKGCSKLSWLWSSVNSVAATKLSSSSAPRPPPINLQLIRNLSTVITTHYSQLKYTYMYIY